MNEKNKTTFLDERTVGDGEITLTIRSTPMYFSIFNSTNID